MPDDNIENHDGKWSMIIQIAHHSLSLEVKVASCRSWIKEGQCSICDKEGK